jgi:uncharacterized protein (DUF58 family)
MASWSEFLKPEVIARLAAVGLHSHTAVEGTVSGRHRSPLKGVSPEFDDYREYSFGDDLKNLDWRAFARSDRFYIKRYEEESNLRAWILLDASASMKYGRKGPTKFAQAATLAACLSAMLIKQRDAAGLTLFDTAGRLDVRPSARRSQLLKIVEVLEGAAPGGKTDLGAVLSATADQMHRRGVVIVLSDLLTDLESFYVALGKLQHAGHDVLVFHMLDRDELELPFDGSVIFRDIEGEDELFAEPRAFRKAYREAMQQFIGEAERRLRVCGIDYLRILTDDDVGEVVSRHLYDRMRRAPLQHKGRMTAH